MTTVTEAAKKLAEPSPRKALQEGDLSAICADPSLAQMLAQQLVEAARELAPAREWSIEDVFEVLEVAVNGPHQLPVRILEGRYFRKRLREHCQQAEQYGGSFACLVISLRPEQSEATYQSILDAVTERLRRTDMVFLYRRRLAMILPRMGEYGLVPLIDRLRELVAVGVGEGALESIASLVFPNADLPDTQSVLDWAEDQLRNP